MGVARRCSLAALSPFANEEIAQVGAIGDSSSKSAPNRSPQSEKVEAQGVLASIARPHVCENSDQSNTSQQA